MEDLNKTQLILLTLLVSFVTSIATGIITVSLLEEAPSNVSQTINRVVEKTIERVVPAEGVGGNSETVREVTTVVVKEEDLVIDAINKNSKSLVRIKDNALVDGVSPFYGIGLLLNRDGLIISTNRDMLNSGSTYSALFHDGTSFNMKVVFVDETNNLAFFKIAKDSRANLPAEPVKMGESEPRLGQTVIAIEGQDKDVVSIGRVASYVFLDQTQGSQITTRINTDIISKTQIVGGPLINLSGEIVGIRTGAAEGANSSFVSLTILKQSVAKAPK